MIPMIAQVMESLRMCRMSFGYDCDCVCVNEEYEKKNCTVYWPVSNHWPHVRFFNSYWFEVTKH